MKNSTLKIINWKFNKTKHLTIPLTISGKELLFILDTVASHTVVDLAATKMLGLKLKEKKKPGGGVGSSTMKVHTISHLKIQFNNIAIETSLAAAMDLSHVTNSLKNAGAKNVHGIIGNDILKKHSAKIDYEKKTLILNSVTSKI